MATSGSVDFTVTRDEIISEALENIGVLEEGESPTAAAVTSAARTLNLLAKSLQSEHIYLRFTDKQTFPTVAADVDYTAVAGTKQVLRVWSQIDGQDKDLDMIDRTQYDALIDKTASGQPTKAFVDYAPSTPIIHLYPVPDSAYTMFYRRERTVEDFDSAADNGDFPVKASYMLVSGLSYMLCGKFQIPLEDRMYWKGEFKEAKINYMAGDLETDPTIVKIPRGVV